MHFPNTTACIGSLLMVTASASTPVSFEVPGTGSGTAAVPAVPEVDTTTVYETSTYYVTSAVTLTSAPVPSASTSSAPVASAPANSSAVATSSCSETAPPAEITPSQSLYVTGSQTFVPVTLWENSTTRVIYPQNSTALEIPTGYPANGTSVVVTTVSSRTATTSKDKTSATASPSATVSEVPVNGAGKVAGDAVLGLGLVAGFMALL